MILRSACSTAAIWGSVVACMPTYVETEQCPRGEQRVDGHCLPTPSLVFQRCIEVFRTTTVELDRGRQFAAGAAVPQGSVEVEHGQRDRERREFTGVAADDLPLAVAECRRQEEAERTSQVARAWADAADARADAEASRLETVTLRGELERARAALQRQGTRTAARFADLPQVDADSPAPESSHDTEVGDTEVGDTEVGDTEVGDAEVGDADG
jgi:hypothetical protein